MSLPLKTIQLENKIQTMEKTEIKIVTSEASKMTPGRIFFEYNFH